MLGCDRQSSNPLHPSSASFCLSFSSLLKKVIEDVGGTTSICDVRVRLQGLNRCKHSSHKTRKATRSQLLALLHRYINRPGIASHCSPGLTLHTITPRICAQVRCSTRGCQQSTNLRESIVAVCRLACCPVVKRRLVATA